MFIMFRVNKVRLIAKLEPGALQQKPVALQTEDCCVAADESKIVIEFHCN